MHNKPTEVIHFKSRILIKNNNSKGREVIKWILIIVTVLAVIIGMLCGISALVSELPIFVLLIPTIVMFFTTSGSHEEWTDAELQFFDEYLVYVHKGIQHGTKSQDEFYKFRYQDIDKIVLISASRRISIYGRFHYDFCTINSNGEYSGVKSANCKSFAHFYITQNEDIDWNGIFEKYTGKEIIVDSQKWI